MHASTRAFLKRGGAACAAAAVLIGGTFGAGAASATTAEPSAAPTSSATASATATAAPGATATASATATAGTELPGGLAAAVKRDLGMSLAEFNAQGELAAKAAAVQAEVSKADPEAEVSIAGDTIKVKTTDTKAATTAAGSAKIAVTTATSAPAPTKTDAASADALFDAYVAKFGVGNLRSIMETGDGNFVIRTGDASSAAPAATARSFTETITETPEKFADAYGNVKVEHADGAAKPLANDVVNGQGYANLIAVGQGVVCSIGWNGFNAAGQAAAISAGHCTYDGAAKASWLTVPTQDPAGKPVTPGNALGAPLGTVGFSQFGGVNNAPAGSPSAVGTDVSVIDGINPALNQLAMVTDWKTPANLSASGPKVTGVSSAVMGAPICKSGRTTGWSCGHVDAIGVFLVGSLVHPGSLLDQRVVRGFGSSTLVTGEGDSGGPVISGTTALGLTSAGDAPGEGTWSYLADLKTALAATPGYTVKIFLNAPTLTTPVNNGTAFRSSTITGKIAGAPVGTEVGVTIGSVKTTTAVSSNGTWTVKAPNKFGEFKFTAQAKNGFSTSTSSAFTVNVIKQTLAAPAITSLAANASIPGSLSAVSGTGKPGATVRVTVASTKNAAARAAGTRAAGTASTAVVGANGKWTAKLSPALSLGSYTVAAVQTLGDWNESKPVISSFKVIPAAPAIASVAPGHQFPAGQGPSLVSGTNVPGATVNVTINGAKHAAVVLDGSWSVKFGEKLASGKYTIAVTQTVEGLTSPTTTATFTVLAAPAPPATQKPTPAPTTPAAIVPTTPASTPGTPAAQQPPAGNGNLASTGASGSLLTLGAAGGLLLLGGAAFLLFRRRSASHQ
ncbi:MAG: hypothetical protein WBX27_09005 [Specibacter sp.]